MTFAKEVRKILVERNMSVAELSFDSRVQEGTIRKILDSDSDPRLSTATKIADALGVTLDSLVHPPKEQSQSSGSIYQSPSSQPPKLHGRAYHQG